MNSWESRHTKTDRAKSREIAIYQAPASKHLRHRNLVTNPQKWLQVGFCGALPHPGTPYMCLASLSGLLGAALARLLHGMNIMWFPARFDTLRVVTLKTSKNRQKNKTGSNFCTFRPCPTCFHIKGTHIARPHSKGINLKATNQRKKAVKK